MTLTDQAWKDWGDADPYYAVLTDKDFRLQSIEERKAAFFATGRTFIDERIDSIRRAFPSLNMKRAMDFGCGVGRLTLPMAAHFGEVVGVDIAPGMLREAEKNATNMGIDNAHFMLSGDWMNDRERQFDFVNTCIVLQHIPVDRGIEYIDAMLAKLAPGGVANIHFTIDRQQGAVRNALYWGQIRLPVVNRMANMLRGRPMAEPMMEMNEYPFGQVLALFEKHGLTEPRVISAPQGSTLAVFLLGQRQATIAARAVG